MQYGWISGLILALTCWWGSSRLMATRQSSGYLVAITLVLLGLAAILGVLSGLLPQKRLDSLYFHGSYAFGVAGLYLLGMALLDWVGWLRLHRGLWLAHLADAGLVFALALWLDLLGPFQWAVGLLANLVCLLVAVSLWRGGRAAHAKWLGFAAVLFMVTGVLIGEGTAPFFGQPVDPTVFHLLLALWVYCVTQVVRHPVQ